jgi:hypothetical protein
MVTLTRTIGQYLKNKGQSTAIPAVPETKTQNVEEGLLGRAVGHCTTPCSLRLPAARVLVLQHPYAQRESPSRSRPERPLTNEQKLRRPSNSRREDR